MATSSKTPGSKTPGSKTPGSKKPSTPRPRGPRLAATSSSKKRSSPVALVSELPVVLRDEAGRPLKLGAGACVTCGSTRLEALIFIDQCGTPDDPVYTQRAALRCQACGAGLLDRREHDRLDWDEVHERSEQYLLADGAAEALVGALAACPAHSSPTCDCPMHRSLRASVPALTTFWDSVGLQAVPRLHVVLAAGVPRLERLSREVALQYPDGSPRARGALRDGWREGPWSVWHPNGQLRAEGQFFADRMTGAWKVWEDDGSPSPLTGTWREGYGPRKG